MPIDRKDWAQRFPEFLVEAETLLAKSEECLSHLQLISNDKDAIDCMRSTLLKLASRAEALALEAISSFPCTFTACSIMPRTLSICTLRH
jgi:hypothetical protein